MEHIFLFILGTLFGSFGNVLILRESFKASLKKSSACCSCQRVLKWYDLFPIISFVCLKGKCRYCGASISFQYPIVEVISGLLLVLAYVVSSSVLETLMLFVLFFFSFVLVVCDVRKKAVPQEYIVPLYVAGFLWVLFFGEISASFISAFVFASPFLFLSVISKERWMGYGDGIVALPLGLFLSGVGSAILAFFLSFWLGFLFVVLRSVWYMCRGLQVYKKREALPLLPFVVLAFFVVFMFGLDIFILL